MIIKPAAGMCVPDPESGGANLPAEGRVIAALNSYWKRRIREGSVQLHKPDAPKPARKTNEAAS